MQENVPQATIDAHEIADLLGMTEPVFRRNRQRYIASGMPRPIPGFEKGLRWSRRNIMRWIDGELAPAQAGEHV